MVDILILGRASSSLVDWITDTWDSMDIPILGHVSSLPSSLDGSYLGLSSVFCAIQNHLRAKLADMYK